MVEIQKLVNYDLLFGYKMGKEKLNTHGFAAATLQVMRTYSYCELRYPYIIEGYLLSSAFN